VVRLAADPDNERAEFALLVRLAYVRQGFGSQMLGILIAYARNRGIGELHGIVLADNLAMRGLCRKFGFIEAPMSEPGVVEVTLRLG
jgi:acetyltransferase